MLLLYADALDTRTKTGVFVTNVAGIRTVNLQKSSLDVTKNPYLLEHKDYFEKLTLERSKKYFDYSKIHHALIIKQKGRCPVCGEPLEYTQPVEVDHIIPYKQGGKHTMSNLRMVHFECHRKGIHGQTKNANADNTDNQNCSSMDPRDSLE